MSKFSGKFVVRIGADLHEKLVALARARVKRRSLNDEMKAAVKRHLSSEGVKP